jgi:hypothetical protein
MLIHASSVTIGGAPVGPVRLSSRKISDISGNPAFAAKAPGASDTVKEERAEAGGILRNVLARSDFAYSGSPFEPAMAPNEKDEEKHNQQEDREAANASSHNLCHQSNA